MSSSRFFGNNKFLSDASIKSWIQSVNPANSEHSQRSQTELSSTRWKRQFLSDTPAEDKVLEAAYAETRSFVDNFINRDELANLTEELKIFDDYDRGIEKDLQFEENGVPKLSSLPQAPSPPPVDYDQPNDTIVNSILEKLLEKPIFSRELDKTGHVSDLAIDTPGYHTGQTTRIKASSRSTVVPASARTADFHARMKIRQEIVKQNREKKELEVKARKQEEATKREVIAEAKRRAAAAQRERELKEKAEEEEIKKEMMKIKQQRESQRKLIMKLDTEKQRVAETAEAAARAEMEFEMEKKKEVEAEVRQVMDEQRRLKRIRLEQILKSRETENIKLLQKCFHSWYGVVVEDRLAIARFRAVSDWRRIIRSWNKWRSATSQLIADREAKQHAESIKKDYQKENAADNHYKHRLLARIFEQWRQFVDYQRELEAVEQSKEERRAKMASFLAAATAAAVVSEKTTAIEPVVVCEPVVSQGVEELFAASQKGYKLNLKELSSGDEKTPTSSNYSITSRAKTKSSSLSNKLQAKRISSASSQKQSGSRRNQKSLLVNDVNSSSEGEDDLRERSGNIRFSVCQRTDSQKQIIKLQRERIRDQQMLIKELSFAQREKEMMQQIAKYEEQLRELQHMERPSGTRKSPRKSTTSNQTKSVLPVTGDNKDGAVEQKPVPEEKTAVVEGEEKDQTETIYESPRACSPESAADLQLPDAVMLKLPTKPFKNHISTAFTPTASTMRTNRSTARSAADTEFTRKMEERAEMRRRLKEDREKKKQEVEQKKLEEQKQEEEDKRRKEEEEKRAKVEELRKKRQLEKEREKNRQAQLQREQELTAIALKADTRRILRHCGWLPWWRLVQNRRKLWQQAVDHDSAVLQRHILLAWSDFTSRDLAERQGRANEFYRNLVVRRCFASWQKHGNYMMILEEKADRHYNACLLVQTFAKWDRFVDQQRRKEIKDEDSADNHNIKRLLRFGFRAWRQIPIMAREERLKKKRLEDMRRRVQEILPDFEPKPETPPMPGRQSENLEVANSTQPE